MATLLGIVTVLSLALAAGMAVIVWRLLQSESQRSEARVEALRQMADAESGAFPEPGKQMLFLFDYGDQWQFKVELIGLGQKEAKVTYPRVVKQVGTAPPQYPDLDEDE